MARGPWIVARGNLGSEAAKAATKQRSEEAVDWMQAYKDGYRPARWRDGEMHACRLGVILYMVRYCMYSYVQYVHWTDTVPRLHRPHSFAISQALHYCIITTARVRE